ncbi:hypothetical protein VNO77_16013 [Canavalia gladiata]|uniref:Uncharacterized protein n=1 Tax=Canavalia gladiata TaxID=3824 RepID=A0AAN9QRM9_CANGL
MTAGITTLLSARFRTNGRDLESNDFGRLGGAAGGGENQAAEKAIIATVCANILETSNIIREWYSILCQLKERHSIDELNWKAGHSGRFVFMPGDIFSNTISSTARTGNQLFLPNATIGLPVIAGQQFHHSEEAEAPPGQSPF